MSEENLDGGVGERRHCGECNREVPGTGAPRRVVRDADLLAAIFFGACVVLLGVLVFVFLGIKSDLEVLHWNNRSLLEDSHTVRTWVDGQPRKGP